MRGVKHIFVMNVSMQSSSQSLNVMFCSTYMLAPNYTSTKTKTSDHIGRGFHLYTDWLELSKLRADGDIVRVEEQLLL